MPKGADAYSRAQEEIKILNAISHVSARMARRLAAIAKYRMKGKKDEQSK